MGISTVIPLYNKASYVERAISSVLNQTWPPDEIIIVDDGSTDDGGKLVHNMKDPRIRYIYQKNQGVSAARNRGIAEVRGELIAFLDADDLWKPLFIEEILKLRQQFPQAGAYVTALESHNLWGVLSPKISILPPGQKIGLINFFKIIKYGPFWSSTIVVPKKVLEEIGGFPVGEFLLEDLDTWLRIALRYPIAWNCEPLAIIHALDWQEKNQKRVKKMTREPKVVKTAREAIAAGLVAPEDLPYLQQSMAVILLSQARFLLIYGKRELAQSFIQSAVKEFHAYSTSRLLRLGAALPGNLYYGKIYHVWRDFKNTISKRDSLRNIVNILLRR
jgi:glycosyltransferase involved in cell wall biosynthesis